MIIKLIGDGVSIADVSVGLGLSYKVVEGVERRHRLGPAVPDAEGLSVSDRGRKKRALDGAGIKHAKGYILGSSEAEFNAMVDRAKPAVYRALKGES